MRKKFDVPLIVISLALVALVVACLYFTPEASQQTAKTIFRTLTDMFGAGVLLFTFFGVLLLIFIACSKYGMIRLGDEQPEYSTFKWIAMMISCGLGSATCYWAFIEWAYYIGTPGLGITPESRQAFEMSVPYTMFHWGISAWTLYAMVGLPVAYHFHVRRNKGLSLSSIVSAITGLAQTNALCRLVDVLFIFICLGGLSITLGVSVPLVTEVLSSVLGIEPKFYINILLIVLLSVVYSMSSFIGLQKGMAKISDWNLKLAIGFTLGILALGPTLFVISNTTQSFGLMLQNFAEMSLFTDSVGKSGFPESWTIFYWLYWITYAPFTGVFIAKVSRGRSVRSVIANTLLSGSAGCFLYFGILGSTSLHRQLNGIVDMTGMLASGQDKLAIINVLQSLPLGSVFMVLFCISTVLFLATTLDGAAFTMASTTTPGLKNNEEPSPFLRLFWCVMLSLVPLTMIFINASLDTIKTCAITTAIPVVCIMLLILYGWVRWMLKDFGGISRHAMEERILSGGSFVVEEEK